MIRAFKTMALGIESIIFCDNPNQAKYVTFRDANDAGYSLKFSDISSVKRCPEYDKFFTPKIKIKTSYSKDYLK